MIEQATKEILWIDHILSLYIIAKNLTLQIMFELLYHVKIFIVQLQFDLHCANKKSKNWSYMYISILLLRVYYKFIK